MHKGWIIPEAARLVPPDALLEAIPEAIDPWLDAPLDAAMLILPDAPAADEPPD